MIHKLLAATACTHRDHWYVCRPFAVHTYVAVYLLSRHSIKSAVVFLFMYVPGVRYIFLLVYVMLQISSFV